MNEKGWKFHAWYFKNEQKLIEEYADDNREICDSDWHDGNYIRDINFAEFCEKKFEEVE